MAKTISANQGSVYLSSTADNPLYILAGVTVSAASQAVYNNHYNSESWTVTNQGTISSTNSDGVYLYNGGTVTNRGAKTRIRSRRWKRAATSNMP